MPRHATPRCAPKAWFVAEPGARSRKKKVLLYQQNHFVKIEITFFLLKQQTVRFY